MVAPEHAGLRFARYARLHGFPRQLPSKAIARRAACSGELTLNGKLAEESRILAAGDVLCLASSKWAETSGSLSSQEPSGVAILVHVVAIGGVANAIDGSPLHWHPVTCFCPSGAAVVWKPSGLRTRGEHAHTLQSALAGLASLTACCSIKPMPLSRLEIGCPGLSLIALDASLLELLEQLVLRGDVRHTFKAVIHGVLGESGAHIRMMCSDSGITPPMEDAAMRENGPPEPSQESVPSSCTQPSREVLCHILQAGGPSGTSTVELETGFASGKCCTLLCWMLRVRGTPVVGDRYAGQALRRGQGCKRAEGRVDGAQSRRGLQICCVRIRSIPGCLPDGEVLDVRVARDAEDV